MTSEQKLKEINEFLEGLLITDLQKSPRELVLDIKGFINELEETDLEDTEDINDMGINDYGTFDFIED